MAAQAEKLLQGIESRGGWRRIHSAGRAGVCRLSSVVDFHRNLF